MNGLGVEDIDGISHPDSHLVGIARRLNVSRATFYAYFPRGKGRELGMSDRQIDLLDWLAAHPPCLPDVRPADGAPAEADQYCATILLRRAHQSG